MKKKSGNIPVQETLRRRSGEGQNPEMISPQKGPFSRDEAGPPSSRFFR